MTPRPTLYADDPMPPDDLAPFSSYGEFGIIGRAVLVLLRQVREQDEQLFTEFGSVVSPKARRRIAEIDALLAEIAALGARRIELAAEADGATL